MAVEDITTKPCIKCGIVDRYKNGRCRPCTLAYKAIWLQTNTEKVRLAADAWRNANREKLKGYNSKWSANNKDKIKEKDRKRYASNPEKIKARTAAWYAANPHVVRIKNLRRRARKSGCAGKLSKDLVEKLLRLQKGKCACCGQRLGDDYHIDHILPLALGGSNTDDNMQLLLPRCNQEKHAAHPVDYMRKKGFLL